MKKVNKDNFIWIFACGLLVVLLGISIYLGVSGWYFKNDLSYTTDLELGKTVSTGIGINEAQAIAFGVDGSYLSGEKLPQIISVSNNAEEDIYLRAKISIYSGQNQTLKMDMQTTINWTYNNQDGYYYFNSTLPKDEKVTLCSYVLLDSEENYKTDTKYIATVVFESLKATEDIQNFWGYNIENDLTI